MTVSSDLRFATGFSCGNPAGKTRLLVGLSAILVLTWWPAFAQPRLACEALEVVPGNDFYNALVCRGLSEMASQRYAEAVATLESAGQLRLVEFPNFRLYTRLAQAYHRLGNREKARENLAKAELAVSVYVGAMSCVERNGRNVLWDKSLGRVASSQYQAEIASEMCSPMYDALYQIRTLESVLVEARLVQDYKSVKKEIDTP